MSWVEDIITDEFGHGFKIGEVYRHPDGYDVKIMSGQFLVRGRLSNFWYWRRVLPDGTLSEVEEHGYGW